MVRNKLAMAVLALSVLQANVAGALGLGNLSVKSALNQPLSAEIKLLDIGDLDASQVKIELGSPEEFQRAAVERDFFLTNLKFSVDLDGHGGGVIRIVTREPVVEPYLNFVIEARWPNGRVLREFAVLLDPPTFNANRAAAAVAPAKSSAASAKSAASPARAVVQPPSVTTEAAPAPAAASADMSLPTASKGGEYRIQVYDTLSKIAARHKPAGDVSVEQTMIAIQRANPQAFIRNNVNLIKSGSVIRLPSADEARAIAGAQASQEVDEQVKEWRGGGARTTAGAATTGPQLDARTPEPSAKEGGYKEQARLSIATPGDSAKTSVGEGSGGSGKGIEALRNQLAVSQESLEKGKRDNHEMQSRLDDMERQIATLQRLISLKDDQLAALQAKSGELKSATPAATATPTPAVEAPTTATTTTTTATTTTTTATEAPAATPAPAAVATPAPKPAPVKAPVQVAKPAPAEPSLIDQLTANPLYLGGAGAAVLLLGALAVQRRRKAAAEEREAESDFTLDDHVDFQIDDSVDLDQARIDDDAVTSAATVATRTEEPRVAPVQPVRSETGDAIAESDIYIAYGRYQQAVDLLSHAIDAEPARSDLRVKLLEVCLEMRNKDAFRQQFVALQGLGDGDAVAHAKDLLSSVDGVSDWLVDLPQAVRPTHETAGAIAATAVVATAAVAAYEHAEKTREAEPVAEQPAAPVFDEPVFEEQVFEGQAFKEQEFKESAFDAPALSDPTFDEPAFSSAGEDTDLDLDLDLDGELDLDAELGAPQTSTFEPAPDSNAVSPAATFESSEFELPKGADLSEVEDDADFDFQLDEEIVTAPTRVVSFDLDSTSTELASEPSPLVQADENDGLDGELDLDLEHDDLDLALSEMGESGYLNDLEELSDALGHLDDKPTETVPPVAYDLDADADLEAGLGDLSDEFDLGNIDAELPDIDRLDLSTPEQAPAASPLASVDLHTDKVAAHEPPAFDALAEFEAPAAHEDFSSADAAEEADDEFDFLTDADEIATKLDLARAYIDMGDTDGAKDILDEVMQEGTDTQKQEASTLLSRIG